MIVSECEALRENDAQRNSPEQVGSHLGFKIDIESSSRMGPFSLGAYRPLTSPDLLNVKVASACKEWRGRRDSNPRPLP